MPPSVASMAKRTEKARRGRWAPQQKTRDLNRAAILDFLARVGPRTFTEILEATKISRPALVDHLDALHDEKMVDRKQAEEGDKRRVFYSLTLKGRVEAERSWLLLLTLDKMARRDARASTGLPYAGPGFVTHTVLDADCGDQARWISEGLADVAWEGVYRGLSRRILRELDEKYQPSVGAELDKGKAGARGKAFFEALERVVGEMSSKGDHRVIVALEVDLPVLARQLGRHPRQRALLKVYRGEQRRAALEEEAKALALEFGLERWSVEDLPRLRRRLRKMGEGKAMDRPVTQAGPERRRRSSR